MRLNRFPSIRWGDCPVCGAKGADYAASSLTSADSTTSLDTTGNGVRLYYYQGQLMCIMCKKEKEADNQSLLAASKHAETEEFLSKAGFVMEVDDE